MLMAYTNSKDQELVARMASAQSDCGLLCSSVYYIVFIDYVIGNASLFVGIYNSRILLSRFPRHSIKFFEISVPRHIRFAELRKTLFEQSHLTNIYVIYWTLEVRGILKMLWIRENCSLGAISPLFHNIFFAYC